MIKTAKCNFNDCYEEFAFINFKDYFKSQFIFAFIKCVIFSITFMEYSLELKILKAAIQC